MEKEYDSPTKRNTEGSGTKEIKIRIIMRKTAMSKLKKKKSDKNMTKKDTNCRNINFLNSPIWKQRLDHKEEG